MDKPVNGIKEFLHPEHEIRFTRMLEIDEYLQDYGRQLAKSLEAGRGGHEWYVGRIYRRIIGIWEESRDWFLSTLEEKDNE